MGKILYIGNEVDQIRCGADSVNKRNLSILYSIFGAQRIIIKKLLASNSIWDKLNFYIGGLDRRIEMEIINLLKNDNDIQYVFLSQSLLGRLAKKIRKNIGDKVKIITFFHNIEKHYAEEYIKSDGFKHFPFYFWVAFNEKHAVKYSDIKIVLNNRDNSELKKYYGQKAEILLPATYEDTFDLKRTIETKAPITDYLFVGTSFFANVEAAKWFINNVLPYVSGRLTIVGKGMDSFKNEFKHERVSVFGFVDDLSEYYYQSSVVIAPIFSGGGMKTKIAEALMYGKLVLGTKEAFQGYVEDTDAMILCDNAEEYIKILNSERIRNIPLFNQPSRDCFINNYSNDIVLKRFQSIFYD